MNVNPSNIAFGGVNGSQQITVTEAGFSGTITAVSNDVTIVRVSPGSAAISVASPAAVFTATSVGIGSNNSGATTITISDGKNTVAIPVTVSVTSGTISYVTSLLFRGN